MRLALTRRARTDRTVILDYIQERSPEGARAVFAALEEAFDLIGQHPHIGQETVRPGVRTLVLSRYPYRIFYRSTSGTVAILHIRHAARRPWPSASE